MLKTSLIAASLLLMATGGAYAQQDAGVQHHYRHYKHYNRSHPYAPAYNEGRTSGWDSPEAFGGVNRFCGPGQIPESFPSGNGVRCELPGGGYSYF